MLHSLGIDGTLKSTTLEGRLREVVSRIEQIEKDNGSEGINRRAADCIKSASNTGEGELYIAECQCYVFLPSPEVLTYPDVYHEAGYIIDTGNTSSATNFNHALAETAWEIYKAEGNKINNPNSLERKLTPPTLEILPQTLSTPAIHNALLTFSFSIPTITETHTSGITIIKAKEYLSNPVTT